MTFSHESARVLARLRAQLAGIADEHTRMQVAAWVKAWDDVAPELQGALDDLTVTGERPTRAQLIKARRLTNALDLIEDRLATLMDASADAAIARLREVVDAAGTFTDQMISAALPPGESVNGWTRVDPKAVDAIVTRATEQITKLSYPISGEASANMKRELIRGMLTGANPRETARRMVARTEGVFNGGLSRALTIARTEQMDAHRAAAQLAEAENVDTLAGWTWVCAVSARTCPACWSMHGSEHPLAEPGPLGHQNCRCARVPRAKTWRELGFDIDEPKSVLPSREDAFGRLSDSEQRDVLGPRRYEAWRDGRYPMDDWSVRRDNPGWRPSYNVSPVPAA